MSGKNIKFSDTSYEIEGLDASLGKEGNLKSEIDNQLSNWDTPDASVNQQKNLSKKSEIID